MSEDASPRTTDYVFVPARSISDHKLVDFAREVWPQNPTPEMILLSWWRRAEPSCAIAAVHPATDSMSGICGGLQNPWIIGGKVYQGVAISSWYVSPRHAGKGIGKRLVRQFEAPNVFMYTFSISDAAAANFVKLGWRGPYASCLMALPIPRLAAIPFSLLSHSGIDLHEYAIDNKLLPPSLGVELDTIESARRHARAHMRRSADDWSRHFSISGQHSYRFCVAYRECEPVGFVLVRRLTSDKGRKFRAAMITDLVVVKDDPKVARALTIKAVMNASEMRADILIMATTEATHRRTLSKLGFLSTVTPALGRFLERRAPQFMWVPSGVASAFNADDIALSFADSDVDFNL